MVLLNVHECLISFVHVIICVRYTLKAISFRHTKFIFTAREGNLSVNCIHHLSRSSFQSSVWHPSRHGCSVGDLISFLFEAGRQAGQLSRSACDQMKHFFGSAESEMGQTSDWT